MEASTTLQDQPTPGESIRSLGYVNRSGEDGANCKAYINANNAIRRFYERGIADHKQVEEGIHSILNRLQPNLPVDIKIKKWDIRSGPDSINEPAIWVRAILADEMPDLDTSYRIKDRIFRFIREKCGVPIWVHVRLTSEGK